LQAHQLAEAQDAEKIESAIQQAVMEARSMARGIFPVHVDHTGLSIALSELAQNTRRLTGTAIEVDHVADVQIESPEVAMHLYRIAQEAVANAVRHSGASQVVISLLMEGSYLKLTINDNGRGIEASEGWEGLGMGLRTMHYRAHAMGAELAIAEGSHGGTSVCCSLKVNATTTSFHHEHV
jgi:signal transduction histidine kinase